MYNAFIIIDISMYIKQACMNFYNVFLRALCYNGQISRSLRIRYKRVALYYAVVLSYNVLSTFF